MRTAIALAAFAGLRSGEVRAIEVQDVDPARGVILVRRTFSAAEVTVPKSGHERIVPIAEPLRPILDDARKGKLPRARLIATSKGTTPSRQGLLTRLVYLERRIGMHPWSFHPLRHAFASTLVRRGASLEAVRLLLGHEDIKTSQGYVHANAGDLTSAVGLLGGDHWQ